MNRLYTSILIIFLFLKSFSQTTQEVSGLYTGDLPYKFEIFDGIPYRDNPCNFTNQKYVKHGQYKSYFYFNNKMKGKHEMTYVKDSGEYKYDKRYGEWIEYYPPQFIHDKVIPGSIKTKGTYFYGFPIDRWYYYDKKGNERFEDYHLMYDGKEWTKSNGIIKGVPVLANDGDTIDYFYNIGFKTLTFFDSDTVVISYKINPEKKISDYNLLKGIGFGYDDYALFISINENFVFHQIEYNKTIVDTVVFSFDNKVNNCAYKVSTRAKRNIKK